MSPSLSIVLPAYNEGEGLSLTLTRIHEVLMSTGETFEIIIVDDGSVDNTWEVIEQECSRSNELKGFRLSRNFGKENAICAGLDAAGGKAVILIDADLQHPPEVIPKMVQKWRQGFQVVDGIKRTRGSEGFLSSLSARLFYHLLGSLSHFNLHGASDFKLLDRVVLNSWSKLKERNVFFRGMSAWVGYRRTTVHFDVDERRAGTSTWSSVQLFSLPLSAEPLIFIYSV